LVCEDIFKEDVFQFDEFENRKFVWSVFEAGELYQMKYRLYYIAQFLILDGWSILPKFFHKKWSSFV